MKDKVFRNISKVDYLRAILVRHRTEYKKILEIITKRNLTHKRGIGFWSLTRMIFPVIGERGVFAGKGFMMPRIFTLLLVLT